MKHAKTTGITNKKLIIISILALLICIPLIMMIYTLNANAQNSEENNTPKHVLNYSNSKYYLDINSTQEQTNQDLPAKYDSRNILPVVRNQQPFGACWTFSSLGAIEASLIKHGLASKDTVDLAERQLAYFFYNKEGVVDPQNLITNCFNTFEPSQDPTSQQVDSYLDAGNDLAYVMWTLASWNGPINEKLAPYNEVADYQSAQAKENKTPGYIAWAMSQGPGSDAWKYLEVESWKEINDLFFSQLEKYKLYDTLAFENDSYHVQNIDQIYMWNPYTNSPNLNEVKQAIVDNGAVATSYCEAEKYYDNTHNSYYDPDNEGSNHAICLVGWDDNFPKSNFPGDTKPNNDGAWLIRNSWGDNGESHGGYFWISYENKCFSNIYSLAYAFDAQKNDNYDNCYQYDGAAGANAFVLEIDNCIANMFKCTNEFGEDLKAVSIGTRSTSSSFNLQIYKNPSVDNPASGTPCLANEQKVNINSAGYHTIKLDSDVTFNKGDTYSVVFTNAQNKDIYCNLSNSYTDENKITFNQEIQEHRSYLGSTDKKSWLDLADSGSKCCARIKAFTNDITGGDIKDAEITIPEEKIIYSGKEQTPTVTVEYDGATLTKDTDYTIEYKDNIDASDNAYFTVTGKGKYYGYQTKYFKINPATLTAQYQSATVEIQDYEKYIPVVEVSGFVNGETEETVKPYKKPIVTLPGKVNPGDTIKITPKEGIAKNYIFDYISGNLIIDKIDISKATFQITEQCTYTSYIQLPSVSVNYEGIDLEWLTDFEVEYTNNILAGENTATATIYGINKCKNSQSKNFSIAPATLTASFENITVKYEDYDKYVPEVNVTGFVGEETSKVITTWPTVTKPATVQPATTYDVTPDVSKAAAPNYKFVSKTGKLTITEKDKIDISTATIEIKDTYTYDGKSHAPKPTVTSAQGAPLTENIDYTLEYNNNINASTEENPAICTVIGKGDYTGKVDTPFAIFHKNLHASFEGATVHYLDYDNFQPQVKVTGFVNGETPETASGYEAPYIYKIPSVEPDSIVVLVPLGGYADNYNFAEWTGGNLIIPALTETEKNLSNAHINMDSIGPQIYDTRTHEPEPDVFAVSNTNTERIMKLDRDYALSYEDNVTSGTATIKVSGINNFEGSQTVQFNILKAILSATYNGAIINFKDFNDYTPQVEVTGFVGGENEETAEEYIAPTIEKPKNVEEGKSYELLPKDGFAKNYIFEYHSGLLTINKQGGDDPVNPEIINDSGSNSANTFDPQLPALLTLIAIIACASLTIKIKPRKFSGKHIK